MILSGGKEEPKIDHKLNNHLFIVLDDLKGRTTKQKDGSKMLRYK